MQHTAIWRHALSLSSSNVLQGMPEEYIAKLQWVLKGSPPRPVEGVKKIIEESLGTRFDDLFSSFDETPLGAASVGQVHRAVLRDGREVAVKVQYPEVAESFVVDFKGMRTVASMALPAVLPALKAVQETFIKEMDFTREAMMMDRVADSLAGAVPDVFVPRSVSQASNQVLMMTLVPGDTLLDGLKRFAEALNLDMSAAGVKVVHPSHIICSDLAHGLLAQATTFQRWVLEQRLSLLNCLGNTYRQLVGEELKSLTNEGTAVNMFVDVHATAKRICAAFGHLILREGLVLGDPHPGNMMLLPDGRLGLIDFGQVASA